MNLNRVRIIQLLRAAIFIIAALCIFTGINRGEVSIVLRKAIRICLECIGL